MKINAGSGDYYLAGWVNVDVDPDAKTDIEADLASVPLPAGCASQIFATHVLEHLDYREQLPAVLAEFRRLLAPGGELCVVGPDIQRAVLLGEPSATLRRIVAWTPEFYAGGAVEGPPRGHAWTSTELLTELALTAAGFAFVNYSGMKLAKIRQAGWPLENLSPWQNGYICKEDESCLSIRE